MPKYRDIPSDDDDDTDELELQGDEISDNDRYNKSTSLRGDGYGGGGMYHSLDPSDKGIQSHNYEPDESEVWRAYVAQVHFQNRGQWWTTGKKRALKRWILTFAIGVAQAVVATLCNYAAKTLSKRKFEHVYELLNPSPEEDTQSVAATDDLFQAEDDNTNGEGGGGTTNSSFAGSAFLFFLLYQVGFAAIASIFVWLEPVSGGSGIPEIKCFLNGIDLPRVSLE